ncbi:beta-ketoacyl synthase N-terminal-like domain-containing protein, partial [Psychrobacter sp. HY3-MNA-CIBAN-0198]
VPQGAYIDQFDFDFLRFKVPPNEDDRLISQQLLLIKIANEAIVDAKLTPGSKVAVLVAMETELELHQFRGRVNLHSQIAQSLNAQGIQLSSAE